MWIVFDPSDRLVLLCVVGRNLNKLDQEAGNHRIQRIPPTEKKGRVHTSSVTVAITNSAVLTDVGFDMIDDNHFRVEWFSGTGAGGQHRNKKQNSCRMIHIPTGTVETRQGRKRESNLREAKAAIIGRLTSLKSQQVSSTIASTRKDQVGSGMRGDKIRTYRFQDDIVTDHRSGKRAKCSNE